MIHPSRLSKVWVVLGAIFVMIGSYNVIVYGAVTSLLTVAVGALIVYSSVYNMGGWNAAFHELGLSKLFMPRKKKAPRKQTTEEKRRDRWK